MCERSYSRQQHVVLVNEPLSSCELRVEEPFSNSDHCSVLFSSSSICDTQNDAALHTNESAKETSKVRKFLWKEGDYESMNEYLCGIDWDQIVMYSFEPNTIWDAFKRILDDANNRFFSISLRQ